MIKYTGDLRCDFEKATAEITKLKDRIVGYQEQIASLRASVKSLKQSNDFHKKNYQESLAEKDAIIKELQNRLAHAEALLNHDGSNTGTPTSQTPINKNKVVTMPPAAAQMMMKAVDFLLLVPYPSDLLYPYSGDTSTLQSTL